MKNFDEKLQKKYDYNYIVEKGGHEVYLKKAVV